MQNFLVLKMSTSNNKKIIALAEIEKHNNRQSCWTIINDKVFDVTKFLDEVSNNFR